MNHSEELEADAVVSAKIDWKSCGSCAANQANSCVIPFGVGDLCGGHLPLRDFARRKDGKHATSLQPTQSLTQSAAIRFYGAIRFKGIDEDAMILKLGYITQQKVGEHFHIGTNAGEENRKQCAIKNAVGMIRSHHDRTGGGDPCLIGGIDLEFDPHLGEEAFESEALRQTLYALIQISYSADRRQLSGEARKLRDAR